jgi:hypothetical protein
VWSGLEAERARTLIMAATNKFATPWGAISFFDRDTEIVQAERGYSRHLIPRRDSIASHVLLTDEVMTVLDARKVNSLSNYLKSTAEIKQDWRFVGNPLVTGNPKICFFAGAPLLSANSQVIGVFAIFGPEPRASFTAMQRRDLTGLSELATRDLTARRDVSSSIILQSSLTLQPGSCDGTTNSSRPTSSPPPSLEMESHRVHSVALRYHKALQNSVPRSRIIINSERRDACFQNVDYTPPNSDDSDEGPSPVLANFKGFGKNYKQLSLAALPNPPPSDIRTPDSPTFGDCPPNLGALQPGSFSVSDLTPLDRDQHPCIPGSHYTNDIGRSFGESRRCNNNFSSDDAVVFLTPHPNRPMEQISDTSSLSINSKAREALLDEALLLSERLDATFVDGAEQVLASASKAGEPGTGSINYEPTDYQDNLDIESAITSDLTSEEVHGSVDVQAEARFAAELWAKNLEFDAIYAVELIPRRKVMKLSELKAPGNVDTCILVAYGLPDPINFDIPIHLDVLRGSGAITWENKNAMPKEYSRGFMMPLLFENGMLDYLSSGVVFGAFRRRPDGIKESPNLRSAEVERLQQAANVLKGILSKSSALRRQSYGEVGPLPSTSPQPYPANEAIEVSQVSLDAGMATCARRKKPKNLMRWQLGGSD